MKVFQKMLFYLQAFTAQEEIVLADSYKNIRLVTIRRYSSETPLMEIEKWNYMQRWDIASSSNKTFFVSMFFFIYLKLKQEKLRVVTIAMI